MIILSKSFAVSSKTGFFGAEAAEGLDGPDRLLVEEEEEEEGLGADLETPRPDDLLLWGFGLEEIISSKDLSRLEDIVEFDSLTCFKKLFF